MDQEEGKPEREVPGYVKTVTEYLIEHGLAATQGDPIAGKQLAKAQREGYLDRNAVAFLQEEHNHRKEEGRLFSQSARARYLAAKEEALAGIEDQIRLMELGGSNYDELGLEGREELRKAGEDAIDTLDEEGEKALREHGAAALTECWARER